MGRCHSCFQLPVQSSVFLLQCSLQTCTAFPVLDMIKMTPPSAKVEIAVSCLSENAQLIPREQIQSVLVSYKASYHIPQSMRGTVKRVTTEVHGVHCGTRQGCQKKECPNFWPKDIVVEECKITCCESKDRDDCSFPLPSDQEIANYKEQNNGGVNNVQAGARGSGVTRIVLSTWLQALSFAIFGWLKL